MICRFGTRCFLNCYGCDIAMQASRTDKAEAARDLEWYRAYLRGKRATMFRTKPA